MSAYFRCLAAGRWKSWLIWACASASCCCRQRRPNQASKPRAAGAQVFRLTGFFSRPQVQKANRNSIYVFVNGRLIRDRLLLHALSSAYYNLMPSAYPFALLFLECDAEEVDVNVHPSKTEVRFRHQSFMHDFVRDTLRERLMETRPAPAFAVTPSAQPAARLPFSEFSQMMENTAAAGESDGGMALGPVVLPLPLPVGAAAYETDFTAPEFALRPTRGPEPRLDFGADSISLTAEAPAAPSRLRVPDTHGPFPAEALPVSSSLTALPDLRPLGQLHDSFIIAAGRSGLWIIDQHVAHERILFEKVLKQRAAGNVEVQRLLMPLVLQLTAEQQIEYARIADELAALGFETEPFGNRTIAVTGAPRRHRPGRFGEGGVRGSGDRRKRAALFLARRCAARDRGVHRLPRGHQNQYAPGSHQDGLAAARARRHRISHELSAWPAHRHGIFHARNSEGVSSDLTRPIQSIAWNLSIRYSPFPARRRWS